jgi:hypothetical protein
MSVEQNVNVVGHAPRRNVLEPKFQPTSNEIDYERPTRMAVAISTHHRYGCSNRAKVIQNALATNIAEVPDFIGAFCHLGHILRQTIVCVGEHENPACLLR